MPKQRITRQQILEAAFRLVRREGYQAVNARNVADETGCSVQPIYSCYGNMELLMSELFEYCCDYQLSYVRERLDPDHYFDSAGRSHIAFAYEERKLFAFVFQSPYIRGKNLGDIYHRYRLEEVTDSIEQSLDLDSKAAERLYMDMMIYTHGIATLIAAEAIETDEETLRKNVDRAYYAFLAKAKEEMK